MTIPLELAMQLVDLILHGDIDEAPWPAEWPISWQDDTEVAVRANIAATILAIEEKNAS